MRESSKPNAPRINVQVHEKLMGLIKYILNCLSTEKLIISFSTERQEFCDFLYILLTDKKQNYPNGSEKQNNA